MKYLRRLIDNELKTWKEADRHLPILMRGARQVGKSTAVRELGKQFDYFAEINLEREPSFISLFSSDIDVRRICEKLSATIGVPIVAGKTLLFIDEIQMSKEAIMTLRYFKEEWPELHVIAAGSLLEFTMEELPSFGVGRIRSLHIYPFSFDEFLMAQDLDSLVELKNKSCATDPLPDRAHKELTEQLRTFYIVGGMPAAVTEWVETRSYLEVSRIHNDIIETYSDDFAKYGRRVAPTLLRQVLRSATLQAGQKFVYSTAARDVRSSAIRDALHLLTLAGLISPVRHTDGTALPLGAEENDNFTKYLFFDIGVMLTMLDMPAADILTATDTELANKGSIAEMFVGLEMQKYADCFRRAELHYWKNTSRNGNAEVDYLVAHHGTVLPIEVKANTRGSMQSLWLFMTKRRIAHAVRVSMENYSTFQHTDPNDSTIVHMVDVVPLYAMRTIR